MRLKTRYLFGVLVLLLGALIPSPAVAASTVTLVASGLDSPRGIAFYHGRMLVAEAGHGADSCSGIPCVGTTSQISWVNRSTGASTPLVTGLFSVSLGPEGSLGVSGLSVRGGKIFAALGATPQEVPPSVPGDLAAEAGKLISVEPDGTWESVAPVGKSDFNYTLKFTEPTPGVYSPGTQEHDANPTGVLATGNGVYVADSGANTLDFVDRHGKISIVHYFGWRDPNPNNFPSDAVPTCIARAEDGLWVADLSGHLFRVDGTKATEVVPRDGAGKPLLSHVTGCTTDGEGNLYLVNMFGPGIPFTSPSFFQGNVVKFAPEEGRGSVLAGNLAFPNMAAVGPDGNLYVTAGSICPAHVPANAPGPCAGGGKVLRINLSHEGDSNRD